MDGIKYNEKYIIKFILNNTNLSINIYNNRSHDFYTATIDNTNMSEINGLPDTHKDINILYNVLNNEINSNQNNVTIDDEANLLKYYKEIKEMFIKLAFVINLTRIPARHEIKRDDWNSNTFVGEWINGKPHGYGKLIKKDGSFTMGEYEYGVINNYGIHSNGKVQFIGKMSKNEEYEFGMLHDDKFTQFGNFNNSQLKGHGYIIYENGSKIFGEFGENNKLNGSGYIYDYDNQGKVIGEFKDGILNDCGYILNKNNKTIGEFKDGKNHGGNLIIWNNKKIMGTFVDGVSNGGCYIKVDDSESIGVSKDGKLNGFGYKRDGTNEEYGIFREGVLTQKYNPFKKII